MGLRFHAWFLTEGTLLTGTSVADWASLPLSLSLWDLSSEFLYMVAGSQEGEQRLQGLLGAESHSVFSTAFC